MQDIVAMSRVETRRVAVRSTDWLDARVKSSPANEEKDRNAHNPHNTTDQNKNRRPNLRMKRNRESSNSDGESVKWLRACEIASNGRIARKNGECEQCDSDTGRQ